MKQYNNHHLSPDAESGSASATEPDEALKNDLSSTSTADPLLTPDIYRVQVVKAEQIRNKADSGNMINIQFKTMDESVTVTGEPIGPGWTLFGRIVITPTPNYPQNRINTALKRMMVSCGVEGTNCFPLSKFEGKICRIRIKLSKPTAEYPDQRNEFDRFEID